MELLNRQQIGQKVIRLAMEILEQNTQEEALFIIGINQRGMELAKRLRSKMQHTFAGTTHLWQINLSPAAPLSEPITLSQDPTVLAGKAILLVDDVANTGRTLFYAMQPLMAVVPKKIEVLVLVDRAHKSFPIHVNYVGLALSTTIQDNILVDFGDVEGARLV